MPPGPHLRAPFSPLLLAVMAMLAQALQLTEPEQSGIATVRDHMIDYSRRALCIIGAHPAQRFGLQLAQPPTLPSCCCIPFAPRS